MSRTVENQRPPGTTLGARTLLSEAAVYAIVDVAQQGLALLALPAFFFLLTPADFGLITASLVATQIGLTLSTLGLDFSVMRLYFTWSAAERGRTLAAATLLSTVWSVALAVALHVGLAMMGLSSATYWAISFGWWAGLVLGLRGVPLSVIRVTGAMRAYTMFVLGGAVTQLVFQLALVIAGFGPPGYMLGYGIGAIVTALASLYGVRNEYSWTGAVWKLPRDTVVFTARVLPSILFARAIAVSDRVVLAHWSTQETLGLYGAASRFTSPIKFLSGGFKLALGPLLSREEQSGTLDTAFSRLAPCLVLGMLLIGALVAVGVWFVQLTPWAANSDEVQRLVGLLLVAQFLSGLMFLGQIRLYYSPQPGSASIVSGVNAAVLIGGLVWLVPRSGAAGAAVAEAASAAAGLAVVIVLAFAATHRLREWSRLLALVATFLPCLAASWLLQRSSQLTIFLVSVAVYGTALVLSTRKLSHGVARELVQP
jgi:O-antigen/teichoic acid export membrane protein